MRSARWPILVALSPLLLTACTGVAAPPDSSAGQAAASEAAAPEASAADAPTSPRALPRITDCTQIAAVAGAYVGDLPLNTDDSFIDSEQIICQWNREQTGADALDQIQAFSVTVAVGDDEVLSAEEGRAHGNPFLFDDARLAGLGGVGVWIDADTAVSGLASGSVLVPGVEMTFVDQRWGAQNLLDQDAMVQIALDLLKM